MKSRTHLSLSLKVQRLSFAFACLMIASAGWAAKIALDLVGSEHDVIAKDLEQPSQVYRWYLYHHQRTNPLPSDIVIQPAPVISPFTNPAPALW